MGLSPASIPTVFSCLAASHLPSDDSRLNQHVHRPKAPVHPIVIELTSKATYITTAAQGQDIG